MPHMPTTGGPPPHPKGSHAIIFLALTFILVLTVALLSKSTFQTLSITGHLLLFAYVAVHYGHGTGHATGAASGHASGYASGYSSGYASGYAAGVRSLSVGGGPSDKENFEDPSARPKAPPPTPGKYSGTYPGKYPGALDAEDREALDYDADSGHRDRNRSDSPPEGNPYNGGRLAAPAAADACVDDEANDDIDGDERLLYQNQSRNDPVRPTAGTMNRRRVLDPYLRGELEEREDDPWWGRHEV